MTLNESTVEDAALEWFGELGYAVGHGPEIAPGEPAAERDSFGEVVLTGRLRGAIARLNPAVPEDAREEVPRIGASALTHANYAVAFRHLRFISVHGMLHQPILSFQPQTLT